MFLKEVSPRLQLFDKKIHQLHFEILQFKKIIYEYIYAYVRTVYEYIKKNWIMTAENVALPSQ